MLYTARGGSAGAQIAFRGHLPATLIPRNGAEGADHYAAPATDALFSIMKHNTPLISIHRTRQTGVNAARGSAVTTLERERNRALLLHMNPSQSPRRLPLEGLHNILRPRMLNKTMNLTEPTTNAELLINLNLQGLTYFLVLLPNGRSNR